jgi:hypothetical protein
METEYDARLREWGEAYEDFEADDVRDLIVRAGERLAAVCLDEEAVDTAMKRLHEALRLPELPTDHEGDLSWRTLWKKTSHIGVESLGLQVEIDFAGNPLLVALGE